MFAEDARPFYDLLSRSGTKTRVMALRALQKSSRFQVFCWRFWFRFWVRAWRIQVFRNSIWSLSPLAKSTLSIQWLQGAINFKLLFCVAMTCLEGFYAFYQSPGILLRNVPGNRSFPGLWKLFLRKPNIFAAIKNLFFLIKSSKSSASR